MENSERQERYRSRPTPAQRSRLKHKGNSRKTHSHAGLPLYLPEGASKARRVPCEKCSPQSTKHVRIGGS